MKTQKKTVTTASLNTALEQEITVKLEDESGIDRIPSEILFIQNSGCEVGVVYLSSDEEKAVKTANPTMFEFVPLDSGRSNSVLPISIKYIIIKQLSGTATADLTFYLLNYIRKDD